MLLVLESRAARQGLGGVMFESQLPTPSFHDSQACRSWAPASCPFEGSCAVVPNILEHTLELHTLQNISPSLFLNTPSGLLSRVVSLRRQMHSQQQQGPGGVPVWPLKLVIMSATLR